MSAPSYNNPAGRLYHLLEGVKRNKPQTSLKIAWAEAFGVDYNDLGALLPRYGYVLGLPNEVRRAMDETDPESSHLHDEDLSKLETFFSRNHFNQSVQGLTDFLGLETSRTLAFCSHILAKSMPTDEEVASKYADIEEKLSELRIDVVESDLPEAAVGRITAYADLISQALSEYTVRGLEEATSVAHGVAVSLQKDVKAGRLQGAWSFVQRLGKIAVYVSFLSDVLGGVANVDALYPGWLPFLPERTQVEKTTPQTIEAEVEDAEVLSLDSEDGP